MKSKWFAYAASLLLTAAVVTASMFLPRVLLARQESGMLGVENNQGISHYQSRLFPRATPTPSPAPSPSAAAPTAYPWGVSLADLTNKIYLLENAGGNRVYQREPAEGEMSMKQAVTSCVRLINEYMKAGAMLPLPNFPNDYTMSAALNTIWSNDGTSLDYWSISFNADPEVAKIQGGIGLMMDAQTGAILSFKMFSNNKETPDLAAAVTAIASLMNLEGEVLEGYPVEAGADTATWVCPDKALFITLTCSNGGGTTSLSMNMYTQFVGR